MESQQLCLMPATCANCDELFDASNDFKREEEITERELLKKNQKLLCWNCRPAKEFRRR
ncbi:hypothetical protein J4229_00615 [Candidatus Pacearchaeota archaeon]|nr:hypothetical protein [Candidatus Pacearchaeota archaeon]